MTDRQQNQGAAARKLVRATLAPCEYAIGALQVEVATAVSRRQHQLGVGRPDPEGERLIEAVRARIETVERTFAAAVDGLPPALRTHTAVHAMADALATMKSRLAR